MNTNSSKPSTRRGRTELITNRYSNKISGVLSCYDLIVVQGIIPGICYAQGMTGYLYANSIKIFDYPRFAESFRDQLRENAETFEFPLGARFVCRFILTATIGWPLN